MNATRRKNQHIQYAKTAANRLYQTIDERF
jgi:hypothetical protein